MKSNSITLMSLAALVLAGAPLAADEVVLKNGRVIEASRIEPGARQWSLTTELGVIEVPAAEVDRVTRKRDTPAAVDADAAPAPLSDPAKSREEPEPKTDPAAAGPFPPVALSESAEDRVARIAALARDANAEGLQEVLALISDEAVAVRIAALAALGAWDDAGALEAMLEAAAQDDDPFGSDAAHRGLADWFRRQKSVAGFSLETVLASLSPTQSGALLFAAGIADAAVVRPLARALLDSGAGPLRAAALGVLRYHMDRELKPRLAALLGDADDSVRVEAALACAVLRCKDQMRPLAGMLEDPDPRVRESAHTALKLLSGVPLPAEPAAWNAWLAARGR